MTDRDLPATTITSKQRQAVVDRLCDHFAQDNMTADELERRLDLAYAARTSTELVALEKDLPALQATVEAGQTAVDLPAPTPSVAIDSTQTVADRDFIVSVWGATERKGTWTPARTLTSLSIMGGAGLDFRQASFATREVSVRLFAIMGGVEIIVPPGVRVEWNGVALMGGVSMPDGTVPPPPDAPVIRITGLVMMGGVEVVEREPGESAREARKRLKALKRERKRLKSGS